MSIDMSPTAVTARLRQLSRASADYRHRGYRKADMSPAGVTRRLRKLSQMRALCLWLGRVGRDAGLGSARSDDAAV